MRVLLVCGRTVAFRHHATRGAACDSDSGGGDGVRLVVENNRKQLPVDDGRREPTETGRGGGRALIFWFCAGILGYIFCLFILWQLRLFLSTLSRVAAKRWVNVINGKGVFSKGLKVNIEKQNSFF